MTSSPSETETAAPPHPLQEFADQVAAAVGGEVSITFDTIKVKVPAAEWASALRTARDELGLVYFSWLSAVDWSNDAQVGDPYPETVVERLEVLATVGDVGEGRRVTFSADLDKEAPSIPSIVEVYAGANWHERETWEMFGIEFEGHPDLRHLYLPDEFVGNPLRKSFPLLSREVKPWPGKVDVEAMPGREDEDEGPSEENPEA